MDAPNKLSLLPLWRSIWNRAFAVAFVFVTLAALLFWLDSFRTAVAETNILVIGKTEVIKGTEVAENLSELSENLSFAERVIKANPDLESAFASPSPDERKKKWNQEVRVKHAEGSGVLSVRTKHQDGEMAKNLAAAASQELLATAAFYYNVKTEVDLRIVEGPILSARIGNHFLYLLTSVVTSLALTGAFFFLLSALPRLFGAKRVPEKAYPGFIEGDSVPYIDPRKFIPRKPELLSYERRAAQVKDEKKEEAEIREEILSSVKPVKLQPPASQGSQNKTKTMGTVKAPAPANLPMAGEDMNLPFSDEPLPFTFEERPEEEPDFSAMPVPEIEETSEDKEPTAEDYKRRLNELLSGGK